MIRQAVSARESAQRYGLQFDRAGMRACCPWHDDRHPSLSFKGQSCHCFACNEGGSALDLTMKLFGLGIKGAAAKLNADFGLGLNLSAPANPAEVRRAQEDKVLAASLEAWLKRAYDTLARRYRLFRAWQAAYPPTDPGASFHAKFIRACNGIDYTEYLLDEIEAARMPDDKIGFYKSYRKEVDRYERELQSDGGTNAGSARR